MGPSTFNFAQAARLAEAAGAAIRAGSMAQALQSAVTLARDARARAAMAERSTGFAAAHRGAADKTADAVVALLAE